MLDPVEVRRRGLGGEAVHGKEPPLVIGRRRGQMHMRVLWQVAVELHEGLGQALVQLDRKSTRLNSSHGYISYAVFCLKKKKTTDTRHSLHIHEHEAESRHVCH